MLNTDLMLRKTLDDYCQAREQAIAHYRSALRLHGEITAGLRTLGLTGAPYDSEPRLAEAEFIRDLDRMLWRQALNATGLPRYMDDEARRLFEDGLERSPPPFEAETVRSTLVSSAAVADEMFARGLYNLFQLRSRAHLTNRREAFKLPQKVIWAGMIDIQMTRLNDRLMLSHYQRDRLNDLDRVFRTLAGEPFEPHRLSSALAVAFQSGDTFEDGLFKVRGFKNGTLHVWFKRPELVAKANRIIADYAGAAIPDGTAWRRPRTPANAARGGAA